MFSTKLDIPNDVLDDFIAMNSNYHGNKIMNLNENIQRVELLHIEEHFNSLKTHNLTSVKSFFNQFVEAIG